MFLFFSLSYLGAQFQTVSHLEDQTTADFTSVALRTPLTRKQPSPDLIWRWASRNQGGLFNIFLYHSLEWGDGIWCHFPITKEGEKSWKRSIIIKENWTCETLGGVFQPTQAFFASFSWMNFWWLPRGCPLIVLTSRLPYQCFVSLYYQWVVS